MRRALVVGYGSIGARHARILAEMGSRVACVTRNFDCPYPAFPTLEAGLAHHAPSHVVVANATADHELTLRTLAEMGWDGPILAEKPLFMRAVNPIDFSALKLVTAFNLRFHPLVQQLLERCAGHRLFSAEFHVGQYLPTWRPDQDYRTGYSASRDRGGGVLRDLSHEIDLAQLFCGPFMQIAALGGHFSDLEIDADDVFHLLARAERCPVVSVQMNYLDRVPRRTLCLNGDGFTAVLDFPNGLLDVNGVTVAAKPERDHTYRGQMRAFLDGDFARLCSLREALQVDRVVGAAEAAVRNACWIDLPPDLFPDF